jgi:uncharacterized protein (DUF2141 family)
MKKLWFLLFALILTVSVVSCGGEDEPAPTPTNATITGTLTLQAGVTGDLNNTRVAIYISYADWAADRVLKSVAATGSGASATYTITDVTPGNYYLDAWKDVDNSATWNSDDLFGVYGQTLWPSPQFTPFSVSAGQTFTANVTMIVLP